ncbi:flagellar basal body L-ring protein FlgH [Donghicola tyrosinivorans]|uniref:Flagellar L-ring protein n=1 Tax=Donghicola tyrosinivorans TaxID=1652492 RepID=A0A2T0WIE9_9RHOB|nr:flagellar basal body L-ring protein FlgH [Donghicola tyrosinivorans]PRY86493.1 flagellar L-ring protein precursor FlgH [Donghicola tyrosinivorans]
MTLRLTIAAGCAALTVAGCSQQIEEAASANYAPVYPVEAPTMTRTMPSGSIYSGGSMGLFATDRKAAQVGDILTVKLSERFAATKSQNATASRSDSFEVDLPNVLPIPVLDADLSASGANSFSGKGSASQSNSLTGRMSVTVARILPGGNLEIIGQKKLTLNNGDEYIRLTGIVRPADISPENIVESDRIANAEIKYIGAGQVADTGKRGWMSRAMNTVSPF